MSCLFANEPLLLVYMKFTECILIKNHPLITDCQSRSRRLSFHRSISTCPRLRYPRILTLTPRARTPHDTRKYPSTPLNQSFEGSDGNSTSGTNANRICQPNSHPNSRLIRRSTSGNYHKITTLLQKHTLMLETITFIVPYLSRTALAIFPSMNTDGGFLGCCDMYLGCLCLLSAKLNQVMIASLHCRCAPFTISY